MKMTDLRLTLKIGKYQDQVDKRLERWQTHDFARRLWAKDPTLWHPEPLPEITDRLGWLTLPERMQDRCEGIQAFALEVQEEGFSQVLLLGMGGSSLAPEVFQKTFGNAQDDPALVVLDSTHPAAIVDAEKKLDLSRTLVLVSSKSGTTLETISLFRYFWARISAIHPEAGRFFSAVTDAGSPLEKTAREKGFREVFLAPPDVGGRYSAFTEFGLVPAALIGLDIRSLLGKGRLAMNGSFPAGKKTQSPGYILGASLGELFPDRDKLTIWTTPSLASFTNWLEQLLAESTGKQGKGIVPVVGEPFFPAEDYGDDRVFVGIFLAGEPDAELERQILDVEAAGHPTIRIVLEEKLDMGEEFFYWELATASAGAILSIHPFNQPDVQLAKDLAKSAMGSNPKGKRSSGAASESLSADDEKRCASAIESLFSKVMPGDYFAVQAYLPATPENQRALQDVRKELFHKTRLATTLGFGPRFLHSTGQLHKGGPDKVIAIQLVDEPEQVSPVPGTEYTFASLIRAQSAGDYQALRQRKRRILRINLEKDIPGGLQKLRNFISDTV